MKHLAAALLRAQRSIDTLELDGRTKGEGAFRYASGEAIIARVRDALHAEGLVLAPTGRVLHVQELGSGQSREQVHPQTGAVSPLPPLTPSVVVVASYVLLHAESGESLAMQGSSACGASVDRRGVVDLDRAGSTAWTYALRDLMRDLSLAPKGRERSDLGGDFGEAEDQRPATPPRQPEAKAHPKPAAPAAPAAPPTPSPAARPASASSSPSATAPAVQHSAPAPQVSREELDRIGRKNATPTEQPKQAEIVSPPKPAQSHPAMPTPPLATNEPEMRAALLCASGWDDNDSRELAIGPDEEVADRNAVIHVVRDLVATIGLPGMRAALQACGVSGKEAMSGQQEVTWAQVRKVAHARNGKQLPVAAAK